MKKLLIALILAPLAALAQVPQNVQKLSGALTAGFTVPTGVTISATGSGVIHATTSDAVTGLSVASGKTLTVSNTLTFTGTDSSSVNFGAGGTVLYSGGSYVSSIAGTSNRISASASTGAVTLDLAGPHAFSSLTSTAVLLGAGTSPISASDMTYVSPTLSVPAGFGISGAGAVSIAAGGSTGTAQNVTFSAGGTGKILVSAPTGTADTNLTIQGNIAASKNASLVVSDVTATAFVNLQLTGITGNGPRFVMSNGTPQRFDVGFSSNFLSTDNFGIRYSTAPNQFSPLEIEPGANASVYFRAQGTGNVNLATGLASFVMNQGGDITVTGDTTPGDPNVFTYGNSAQNNYITVTRTGGSPATISIKAFTSNPILDFSGGNLTVSVGGSTVGTITTAGVLSSFAQITTTTTAPSFTYGNSNATFGASNGNNGITVSRTGSGASTLKLSAVTNATNIDTDNTLSFTTGGSTTLAAIRTTGEMSVGASTDAGAYILQAYGGIYTTGSLTLGSTSGTVLADASGAASLTGGAGNMTITAGTGNSRTMTFQTTTSGGTATSALVISATQVSDFRQIVAIGSTGGSNLGTTNVASIDIDDSLDSSIRWWRSTSEWLQIAAARGGFTGQNNTYLLDRVGASAATTRDFKFRASVDGGSTYKILVRFGTGDSTGTQLDGMGIYWPALSVNDNTTATSGTATSAAAYMFDAATATATNTSVTTTNGATVKIGGDLASGTNNTVTNGYGLWNVGKTKLDGNVLLGGTLTKPGGATLIITNTALTDGAGAQTATFTNSPVAGNPTKWIGINDNGTTRYVPAF